VGLLVPLVIWLAAMSMAAPSKPGSRQETTAESATQPAWGESVKGIQARLRVKKAVWAVGEPQTLHCELTA